MKHKCIKNKINNELKYNWCQICKDNVKYPDGWIQIHILTTHPNQTIKLCEDCGDIIKIIK